LIMELIKTNFTPSELIFLRADEFVPAAGMLDSINMIGAFELIHKPGKVQARAMSHTLLSAAILAANQMGNIKLEIGVQGGLLGLFGPTLKATSVWDGLVNWPEGSLESKLVRIVQRNSPMKISKLVYELLDHNDSRYVNLAPEMVREGMATRKLLIKETSSFLMAFKTDQYYLPQQINQLAAAQSMAAVQQLLQETEKANRVLWKMLQNGIKKGMEMREDKIAS